ncbi:transposase [Komagataeibacter medellinensis NBRC 3288]|uniref:Transposase n=1 Tax=Komagataeibacter medellinensis (strain NBRC 3288 / BCRC 11682 / LMG 1693 / Kondo 51) TaxID=634177 RepID=G2I037_KOMMN|nr:transposase [Komagataeibacter medellinensis NBRC 3288]
MEIQAAEITGNDVGDAPVLPMLLAQIPQDEESGSVTVDGAYNTRSCHNIIVKRGADAIIPPRQNAKPWRPTMPDARARNEAIRASECFGRAIWRRWSGYHRRSRVETKMHCIKLLGQRLTARDFDRQVTEFFVRIAILNQFTALGIPLTAAIQ